MKVISAIIIGLLAATSLLVAGCGESQDKTFSQAQALRVATSAYLEELPSGDLAKAQALLNLAQRTRQGLPIEGKRANLTWSATGEIIRGIKKDDPKVVAEYLERAEQLLGEALTQ